MQKIFNIRDRGGLYYMFIFLFAIISQDINNLYAGGNGTILETITINNKKWTVRKSRGHVHPTTRLNVRDNPGLSGNRLFLLADINEYVDILAVTEEYDTIDGITYPWLKIKDPQGRIGWIFGGYVGMGKGGLLFYYPDGIVGLKFSPE